MFYYSDLAGFKGKLEHLTPTSGYPWFPGLALMFYNTMAATLIYFVYKQIYLNGFTCLSNTHFLQNKRKVDFLHLKKWAINVFRAFGLNNI